MGAGRKTPTERGKSKLSREGLCRADQALFVARIVEPIAPNFFALRRVSSNADRAYVSIRSPCSMST